MKINSGVNVESYNWSNVRSHIERKFEDTNLSERNWDSNLGINWKLSQFNKGTDGKIVYNKGNLRHPYTFKFNRRSYNHIENMKLKMIRKHVSSYVNRINSSKSVKINPKRKITKLSQIYNPKSERTTVDGFSSGDKTGLQTNYGNIKLIQKHYGKGYKNAYIRYIKAVSLGLENYEKGFNSRYKYVKKFHHFSNVDETTGDTKPSKQPDALHDHSEIIGFTWSKYDKDGNPITQKYQTTDKKGKVHNHRAGKPSFDVDRALCHEFNIKYSKKNAGRALSIFRKREAKEIVKNVQSVLEQRFSKVPEFHTMTYTPTKSQQTGLSQSSKKRLLRYKDKVKKDVASRNRNRARRLIRETRKLEYKKAHRKRNRARARRAIKRKNRAKRRYAEYQRANESLKAAKEKYAHNVNSYAKQAFSMSNEASKYSNLRQYNSETYMSQINSMADTSYSKAQPRIKEAVSFGKSSISVSASISASASVNDVAKSLSDKSDSLDKATSDYQSQSASFDSSAYGGYARQLSNVLTPYMTTPQTSQDWLKYAKGDVYINSNGKHLKNPLSIATSVEVSRANSANSAYSHFSASASSISSASSFASSALSNANTIHDNTRSMMTDTLMNYDTGYKGTSKLYQYRNYIYTPDKSLFTRFKDTVKNVVHKAKATIEKYVMPNHYAKELMYSFLNYYDPHYSNHNYTDRNGNPLPDAHTIKDTNQLQDTFNTELEIVHNQRQNNLEHNRNLGKPWTPPI